MRHAGRHALGKKWIRKILPNRSLSPSAFAVSAVWACTVGLQVLTERGFGA